MTLVLVGSGGWFDDWEVCTGSSVNAELANLPPDLLLFTFSTSVSRSTLFFQDSVRRTGFLFSFSARSSPLPKSPALYNTSIEVERYR